MFLPFFAITSAFSAVAQAWNWFGAPYQQKCIFVSPNGDVFYRGQHLLYYKSGEYYKGILRYSYLKGCFISKEKRRVKIKHVKKALRLMEKCFQAMPEEWDLTKPHLFRGRELYDEFGQPLRLLKSGRRDSNNLSVINSSGHILSLRDIQLLCDSKFGKLELIDGEAFYRGHPVDGIKDLQINSQDNGVIAISYCCESTPGLHYPLSTLFAHADFEQIRLIVERCDIAAFEQLLEEYPMHWVITTVYIGDYERRLFDSFINQLFRLSPDQRLADLFIAKYEERVAQYIREDWDVVPDSIIDSPMSSIEMLVKASLCTSIPFMERLVKRLSSSVETLSFLNFDKPRIKIIAQILETTENIIAFFWNGIQNELREPFGNLLKYFWLSVIPDYLLRRRDLLIIVWEKTKAMDLDKTKKYAQAFSECYRTLKMVCQFKIPENVVVEIASKSSPEISLRFPSWWSKFRLPPSISSLN